MRNSLIALAAAFLAAHAPGVAAAIAANVEIMRGVIATGPMTPVPMAAANTSQKTPSPRWRRGL
jgi:hypothetical protein